MSGYLGSGKTTLVGHLLDQARAEGVRLAIISNEFGDTGIDRALLDSGMEDFVELDGGCVCCKLSDALGETITAIMAAARPDRIVLETSGVALPGELVLQFWRPPISDHVSDEVVVVVVDAERAAAAETDETFVEQLGAADLVLLNKCDLVDAAGLAAARAHINTLTHGQPIIEAVRGEVAPELLFPPDPAGARRARRDPDATSQPHRHERFNTRELTFHDNISTEDVIAAVAAEGAIRAKGFVRTDAGVLVLQGVGPRIELTPPRAPVDPAMIGRVVVIYRDAGHDEHQ